MREPLMKYVNLGKAGTYEREYERDNIHQIQCNVPREQKREQKKTGL